MARTVKMTSDMDTTMMEVERVDRAGDRLMVTGVMMGNFPTEIYLEPADLLALVALHLRASPLGFVAGLPWFWLRRYLARPENRSLGGRLRGAAIFAAFAGAELLALAAFVLGMARLAALVS